LLKPGISCRGRRTWCRLLTGLLGRHFIYSLLAGRAHLSLGASAHAVSLLVGCASLLY